MKKAAKKTAKAKVKKTASGKAKAAPAKKAKRPAPAPRKKAKAIAKKPPAKKTGSVKPAAKQKSPPVAKPKSSSKKASATVKRAGAAVATMIVPPLPPAPVLASSGAGTIDNPWILKTPAGFSEFQAYRDDEADPPAVVVRVGTTELRYHLRSIEDLVAMLKAHGDWMPLGSADEQQVVEPETVEAWARSPYNPNGGWYGLRPGLRGRFATYIPQVLEALGLAEVEHYPNNNRMRAK